MSARIRFEPRDLWIGLYWTREDVASAGGLFGVEWTFYICLVPMFPLIVRYTSAGWGDDR